MSICIVNCYHWIGFHLANAFLEMGYEVFGVDQTDNDNKENLAMFLGRNSRFHHREKPEICQTMIEVPVVDEQGQAAEAITISRKTANRKQRQVTVQHSFLFGEWMPMSSKSGCCQGKSMRWDTPSFANEAIWIDDFAKCITLLVRTHLVPEKVELVSSLAPKAKEEQKSVIAVLNSTSPIEKSAELQAHYRRFSFLYQAEDAL